jgi:protein-L-isoaspartate O-methyltransferase
VSGHLDDPAELRVRMIDRLLADDGMAGWSSTVAQWQSALATVPRHEFIPDTVWIKNPRHWPALLPLHRDDNPAQWLELAYGDDSVVTQVDDGHPDGPGLGGSMPTSSASSPVIVAIMLAELDAHPGHSGSGDWYRHGVQRGAAGPPARGRAHHQH